MVQDRKKDIRKEIIRRLRDQDPQVRDENSLKIQEKLLASEEFRASTTVMTYVSMPTEVSTWHFIEKALERGKKLVVPFIEAMESATIIASELMFLYTFPPETMIGMFNFF